MVLDRKAEHRERSTLLFGWPGVFSLSSAGGEGWGEEAVSAAFSERHHDFFALRRMFDRIINQIHECLLHGLAVDVRDEGPLLSPALSSRSGRGGRTTS